MKRARRTIVVGGRAHYWHTIKGKCKNESAQRGSTRKTVHTRINLDYLSE